MAKNSSLNSAETYGVFPSDLEFWIQNIIFYIICSTFGILTNILVLYLILRKARQRLRHPFYILISFYSVLKVLACFWTLFFGVYQTSAYKFTYLIHISRLLCLAIIQPMVFAEFMFPILIFLLASERWLFVMRWPLSLFKRLTAKNTTKICCSMVILTILHMTYVWVHEMEAGSEKVRCINPVRKTVSKESFIAVAFYYSVGLTSVILYGGMLVGAYLEYISKKLVPQEHTRGGV